jgi:hypothetical protein
MEHVLSLRFYVQLLKHAYSRKLNVGMEVVFPPNLNVKKLPQNKTKFVLQILLSDALTAHVEIKDKTVQHSITVQMMLLYSVMMEPVKKL